MSSSQPVELRVWSHSGDRADLDGLLDTEVRARAGEGRWTRHCGGCASDQHGGRIFVPTSGSPFAVSVAHAGTAHVAVTTWGASRVGVDVEHVGTADTLGDLPLWPRDTDTAPDARLARWVAHETRVKLTGRGLATDATSVPLLSEPTEELREAHGLWWRRLRWTDLVCIVASDCNAVLRTSAIASAHAGPSVFRPGRP